MRVAEARLPTDFGEFRIAGYRSLNSDEEFVALACGELRADRPTLVRIHSQCMTGDVFGSVRCDCGRQLRAAMELIGRRGMRGRRLPAPGGAWHRHHQQDSRIRFAGRGGRHRRGQRAIGSGG